MEWLGLRIWPSTTKEKKKGKTIDNPQSKVHKEYTRRTQSESRKNNPVDPEGVVQTIDNQELKRKLDAKIKESLLLKTTSEHEITIGLQAVPQASIHPVVPTIGIIPGEGASQVEAIETQPPPTMQTPTLAPAPTQERVIIHNIKIDSD